MQQIQVRNLTFGQGRMKICVPVCAKTTQEAVAAITAIRSTAADLAEWRVDYMQEDVVQAASAVLQAAGDLPVLCTFRTKTEGGEKDIDPAAYFALNTALAEKGAAMIDLELMLLQAAGESGKAAMAHIQNTGAKVVVSNHDFHKTPNRDELVSRYRAMHDLGGDLPKIAVMPQCPQDVQTMFAAMDAATSFCGALIGISMGELGKITRIQGGAHGSVLTFASVGKGSAPGQIDVETLLQLLEA